MCRFLKPALRSMPRERHAKEEQGAHDVLYSEGEDSKGKLAWVETTLRLGCAGMGDVLSLVEKAEASIKEEDAAEITKRMLSAKFDFNDFLKQYKMVSGMGSMGQIMKMLPGESAVSYLLVFAWTSIFLNLHLNGRTRVAQRSHNCQLLDA